MALQKSVELPDGTTVTYWRIVRWTCDVRGRQIAVIVEPYLSDAARLANKEPVEAGGVVVRLPLTAALAFVSLYADLAGEDDGAALEADRWAVTA